VNEHADEYGVTGNDSVLQGSQSGPRETSRVWLLFGTLLAVLALRLTPDNLRFSSEPEPATTLLSSYIIDTEFLTRVALQHKNLIGRSDLLAPEIRLAVLDLAAASQTIAP
jgi:hypothetical protein